ncbi:MAG: hypothetical protein EAZ62_01580 [Sphingobacteriia bacterium]|nr:MAG: hypothetical protein EAZ62_01580 [Sphingobacteriia bacterium]
MKYILVALLMLLGACQKKWEAPTHQWTDSSLATHSLRQIREKHIPGNVERIQEEWVIRGQVTANDATDNFYKTIVIADSSGALPVLIDAFALHLDFPIGMQVSIRLKGLYLGEYGGLLQLGGELDLADPVFPDLKGIPAALVPTFIKREGPRPLVAPMEYLPEQLGYWQQAQLVRLVGMELDSKDTAKSFADLATKTALSHPLRNCQNGLVYLRSSGFAQFAALGLPNGNGRVQGIFTVFGSQKQLQVRDTNDLDMRGPRCGLPVLKTLLQEDFETHGTGKKLGLMGWQNFAESGKEAFQVEWLNGNRFAQISGAFTQAQQISNWLILPAIDLAATRQETLQFKTRDASDNGATLQVLVSAQYDGKTEPWKFKWNPLKASISKGSVGLNTNWLSSGSISLQGFSGKVFIAFRYEGADPPDPSAKKTTLFQLDDILVTGRE